MSDRIIALLRTVVPTLWSAAVAWLILRIPALQPVADQLGAVGELVLVPLVLAAYKALANRVEPLLPAWLRALLLGAARMPAYPLPPASARRRRSGPRQPMERA